VAESAAIRDGLLAQINRRRAEFELAGDKAEKDRTLPNEAVATLRSMGIFWLKTPAELGGTPLEPLDFCDVMEELAYTDSATAWTAMVGNGGSGTAGGWLPDEGARAVFSAQRPRPLVVGTPGPRGVGRAVPGGFIVSGRWGFASGIARADWVIGGFRVPGGSAVADRAIAGKAGGDQFMVAIVPREQAQVIDNWHVAGLQGTGSFDFRLDDAFVPAERTFLRAASACRGGALFHQEAHVFLSNELPPLAVGIARRALDEMTALAGRTARFPGGPVLSERAAFHSELGRAEARIAAARLAHRDAVARAYAVATRSGGDALQAGRETEGAHIGVATASVYAVDACAAAVADLFRYAGGRAASLTSPMQRHLRDLLATRQHIGLSEENYERAGRFRVQMAHTFYLWPESPAGRRCVSGS
jgi:alkylation response protein AidB-like acyl-CoA dehydrogenase